MQTILPAIVEDRANRAARTRLLSRRGEPLWLADWERALFLHYEVDATALQREVSFPLDLREGRACVSLVAFTIRGMRFRFGGRASAWLCRPIATHEFLNFRTYVRHRDEPGIVFLSEWLPNPLSVRLGPLVFGLPYRLSKTEYRHEHETGRLRGRVFDPARKKEFRYEASLEPAEAFEVCPAGSLDEFLLERYTAFTSHRAKHRFFRIWHEPWRQQPVQVSVRDDSLIRSVWPWFAGAKLLGANYSPGARHVWMGWPHGISGQEIEQEQRTRTAGAA